MNDKVATRFGPYRLLHQLGAGGMGQVFLASQQGEHGITRLVAIKRILAHLNADQKLLSLFLDEVRIAAQVNHGNVVQVVDHGSIEGRHYMAMEYVHGENLADVLARLQGRGEELPLDLALHIACCVCEGLDYAHRRCSVDGKPLELVHRDISPQNLMLSFDGEVKIADFGIARAAEQQHQTLGGELRGKLNYMSPEQAHGKDLDRRSDLFSLGIVLYEVLGGKNPVDRGAPLATLDAVRAADIAPLNERRPELPPELCELVHRLLARDPDERPDSARALHEALQGIMRLHNQVVSAFDLADYLRDLFPEAQPSEAETPPAAGGTAAGRRADELGAEEEPGAVSRELVRRTLFYQRRRRPEGGSLLLANEAELTEAQRLPRRPFPAWLVAVAAALIAGGAVALWTQRSVSPNGSGARDGALRERDAGRGESDEPRAKARRPESRPASQPTPPRSPPLKADARGDSLATVRVISRPPGAELWLRDRRRGHTPLSLRLPPGRHRIELRREGYRLMSRELRVHRGQTLRRRWKLIALESQLVVKVTHPCALRVGSRLHGPLSASQGKRLELPAGALELRCRHKSGATARRRVRLLPGRSHTVTLAFGVLTINVQPWASVRVDGKPRGDTPLRLLLAAGSHRLELYNPQAKRKRQRKVEVRPRATTRISAW